MLNPNAHDDLPKPEHPFLVSLGRVLLGGIILVTGFVATVAILSLTQSPLGALLKALFSWLFAANSVQAMWYVTRSAGFAAYLLLWFSTALGLAIPTKLFDRLIPRAATFDFHQFISLLAIGFILLHIGVLLVDRYLPFTLAQVLIPFISPYRPVWVGIGVLGFYLTLLVTITFYIRSRIGMRTFKIIHYLSLVSYLGVTIHAFLSGTDSSVPVAMLLYLGTFAVIVFLTAYWLIYGFLQLFGKKGPAAASDPAAIYRQQQEQAKKALQRRA